MRVAQHAFAMAASVIFIPLVFVHPAAGGIAGLHKWIRNSFSNAARELQRGEVVETDHLLFDLNQLLHQAALTSSSIFCTQSDLQVSKSRAAEARVIRALRSIIGSTFKRFKVKKSVVFALDGVPPLAKLSVSQRRRERAAAFGLLSACIEQSLGAREGDQKEAAEDEQESQEEVRKSTNVLPEWRHTGEATVCHESGRSGYNIPSYLLSPGTHFMTLAEQECMRLSKQILQSRRFRSLRFFVSGTSSYGEGELKLADWINSTLGVEGNPTVGSFGPSRLPRPHPADSVVIIGGDADLLVQCLALPSIANLYVYSPQAFTKPQTNKVLYSLHALLGELERHFPGKSHLAMNDLALLCMLNGNDYLPKIPGFSFNHFAAAYEATRRRPDCANEALIDSERKSFNWPFFSVFLEELDSLSSFARIAKQRGKRLRLARSSAPEGTYRTSPLQILNQLVAQKRLGLTVDGSKGIPSDGLQWSCHAEGGEFICSLKLPARAFLDLPRTPLYSTPVSFRGKAMSKKVAQQRAAFQVLEHRFPQLLHLVDKGSWNESEGVDTANRKADCFRVTDVADFHRAAARLRATTPSNTLNNLCLAALHAPPTFCFVPGSGGLLDSSEIPDEQKGTSVAQGPDAVISLRKQDTGNEPPGRGARTTSHAVKRVDVVAKGRVIFSYVVPQGQTQSKAKLRHATSMQALQELGPTLYAALRKLAWEDDGSRLLGRRSDETHRIEAAISAATPSIAQAAAAESDVKSTEEQFAAKAHAAQEAAKAVSYLHGVLGVAASGLLWNLHMYVDGVCPDNQWHYPFSSGPFPSAVQEVVHLQLHAEGDDPFSRLFPRCRTKTAPAVPVGADNTPQPIPQCLYTAALLPPEALQDLDMRERAAAADGTASHSKRLVQARALLEAAVEMKRLRKHPAQDPAETEGHSACTSQAGADVSTKQPTITADEVLLATQLLKREHQPDILRCPESQACSYWTMLHNDTQQPQGPPFGWRCPSHEARTLACKGVKEEKVPIFTPPCLNRPWTKSQSDRRLSGFSSLPIIKRPRAARRGAPQKPHHRTGIFGRFQEARRSASSVSTRLNAIVTPISGSSEVWTDAPVVGPEQLNSFSPTMPLGMSAGLKGAPQLHAKPQPPHSQLYTAARQALRSTPRLSGSWKGLRTAAAINLFVSRRAGCVFRLSQFGCGLKAA
ncbi:hypothetical protein Esti_004113 [Eimeria stiedai]